jgi:cysteinyl-tRNA synthetase
MVLRVYNTATHELEEFKPRMPGRVQFFVCGPTVYDLAHAGHAKTYTQFDFIARYLARSYDVSYLLNITDVDDKIIRRAAEKKVAPETLAKEFEALFWSDMAWLGNAAVTQVAHATDYIDAVVDQVERLIAKGVAYQLSDGWYFDIAKAGRYGVLSPALFDDDTVSRVNTSDKHNAGDFVLWKMRKPGEPFWSTRLGEGRPGWHIEDTAITEQVFGSQYDVHGGAIDLIFPHHEAEIAQMETISGALPMVNYWLHTGLLVVGDEEVKMSKSLNNFVTIESLKSQVDALTLRFIFLSQHYRSPLDLSAKRFDEAVRARGRIESYMQRLGTGGLESVAEAVDSLRSNFFAALDQDFNAAAAFAVLFEFIRKANHDEVDYGLAMRNFLTEVNDLFKTFDFSVAADLDDSVQNMIRKRNSLRAERQFTEADVLREILASEGVTLEDKPEGTAVLVDGRLIKVIS